MMMFENLTKKQQRNLAIELFIVFILLVLWLFVTPLWKTYASHAEQTLDLRFQLAKYEQAINSKTIIASNKASLQKLLQDANLFHENIAHGVVAAKVQNTIREMVEKSQGSLVSTQVLPERKEEQFTRLAVNVRLTGDDLVLHQLLFEIEMARPILTIEKLTVSSRRRSRRQNTNVKGVHNITLEVASYIMRDAT